MTADKKSKVVTLRSKGNKKDIAKEPEMKELKRMIWDGELDFFRTEKHLKKGGNDMEELNLGPSWVLTLNHAASSYGQPVLVNRTTGEAFGPGDIVEAYPSWGYLPGQAVVERFAKTKNFTEKEMDFVGRFLPIPKP